MDTKNTIIDTGMNLKQVWRCSNSRGFTLVELVVTITIITILSTVGFVSLWWYFASARDGARLADMQNIYGQLNLALGQNGELPMPEDYATITLSGTIISYQWIAGKSVLNAIGFEGAGRDPKDDLYYTYSINSKKSKAQLMVHFEEYDVTKLSNLPKFIPETYAAGTVDYTNRVPGTIGKKIGILVNSTTLVPVSGTGMIIEVTTTTTPYMAYFDNITKGNGTGAVLSDIFLNNGNTGSVVVVVSSPVGTFSISSTSISVGSGAIISNNCTSAPTSYTSSDTSVATISGTGITALKSGSTTITPVGWSCADLTPKTLTVIFGCGTSTVTDSSNYTYNTITVGSACWMTSNLRTSVSSSVSANGSSSNDANYGKLYTWSMIMSGSTTEGAQGICPSGWHIPTNTQLIAFSTGTPTYKPGDYDGFSYGNFDVKLKLWSSKSGYLHSKYDSTTTSWLTNQAGASDDFFSVRCIKD